MKIRALPALLILAVAVSVAGCERKNKSPYRPDRPLTQSDYITSNGAVMCILPTSINEALTAAANQDDTWLKQAGCLKVPAGFVATRIDPLTETPGTWQVHLYADPDTEQTLYTLSCELKRQDGSGMPCM